MKRLILAALVVALSATLADAGGRVRVTRRAAVRHPAKAPSRVKVKVKTADVKATAKAGQDRWEFWDGRSSKANVRANPIPR